MAREKAAEDPRARAQLAAAGEKYWEWDRCRWGTHRVNCYPGSCPFKVYASEGRVIREEISCTYPEFTDPEYRVPDYNPRGCQKGYQHSVAMYGPDRLLYPMKRKGERGSGAWERISWEQAFDEIGSKVADVIVKYGPQALIDDHATNGIGMVRGASEITITGMTAMLGGVSYDINFMIGDFNPGQYLTFGQFQHAPGIETWFLADTLIVLSNPIYANIPDVHYILEARYRGAKVVAISPDKTASAQFADMWLPVNWSADPAVWLGVCRILIENGWIDSEFIREQTDLPVIVRKDNGRFLREADLMEGGDPEQFYALDCSGKLVPLPKGTLEASCEYALEGDGVATLKEGTKIELTTVYALLNQRLSEYTPEKVHALSGVHPDQLRELAELCRPPRKVFVFVNWNAGKLYHGDLLERSYCYMLALTGNLGKPGTGTRGWSAGTEFGCAMPLVSGMPKDVLEDENPILASMNMLQMMAEDYKTRFKMDATMPPVEAAFGVLREMLKTAGILSPPAFLWYYHAGYKEVWDKHLEDPNSPRKNISSYAEEALAQGWWQGFDRPARNITPRAMFVSGSNPLRRHRGGMNTYLKNLWPKLELVVVLDPRKSTTGLHADYMLPAASHYEYADAKYTSPHTRFNVFTDETVPPVGESRTDRQIVLGLLRSVESHLKKRGVEKYKSGDREIVVDEIYWRATYANKYGESNEDEERLLSDTYQALGKMGWFTSLDGEELNLENMRKNGKAWLSGRPTWHATVAQNADMVPGDVHTAFRDQIEQKVPWATTTRRIEFYLDHPWFIEADEHLVRYKQPPHIGGRQPLRLTSGHLRWSVHANWVVANEMLKLHRGEPFAFVNQDLALERGVDDNDYMRVFNDYGSFIVRAKLSPCVRPDQMVIYHAWEPYQYPNGMPYDGLLPGPPKGLHFAGGYRHYQYTLWNWSPSQSDRQTSVEFEKADLAR